MNTQDELKEFFINSFIPIDNIPENTTRRDSICMEARASLLIEANCTSEYFPECPVRTAGSTSFPNHGVVKVRINLTATIS